MATIRLAEQELRALGKYAKSMLLWGAQECVRYPYRHPDEPSIEDRRRWAKAHAEREWGMTSDEERRYDEEARARLLGAANVYGALKAAALGFSEARGLPEPGEWVEIEFTEAAYAWLEGERLDLGGGLKSRRGTIEIGQGAEQDVFVSWVLEGIAQQLKAVS